MTTSKLNLANEYHYKKYSDHQIWTDVQKCLIGICEAHNLSAEATDDLIFQCFAQALDSINNKRLMDGEKLIPKI